MPYVITKKCAGCVDTACVEICPCDCIIGPVPLEQLRRVSVRERAGAFPDVQMFIDPDECIDCGACTSECPADAIYRDDDVPAEHRGDIERNAAFFRGGA
jgi:NAD-dependent dihydropyrimidine dehydrogenase PreA subunit